MGFEDICSRSSHCSGHENRCLSLRLSQLLCGADSIRSSWCKEQRAAVHDLQKSYRCVEAMDVLSSDCLSCLCQVSEVSNPVCVSCYCLCTLLFPTKVAV